MPSRRTWLKDLNLLEIASIYCHLWKKTSPSTWRSQKGGYVTSPRFFPIKLCFCILKMNIQIWKRSQIFHLEKFNKTGHFQLLGPSNVEKSLHKTFTPELLSLEAFRGFCVCVCVCVCVFGSNSCRKHRGFLKGKMIWHKKKRARWQDARNSGALGHLFVFFCDVCSWSSRWRHDHVRL